MILSIFFRRGVAPVTSLAVDAFSRFLPPNNLNVSSRTFVNCINKDFSQCQSIFHNSDERKFFNLSTCIQNRGFASKISAAGEISSLKKRIHKKRYISDCDPNNFEEGRFSVVAFATAEEYDLEKLKMALTQQKLYRPLNLGEHDAPDVLLTVANYKVGSEPRHMFFFREGSVVLWNCTELEISNVLAFLKDFEEESYAESTVLREKENMSYKYLIDGKKCCLNGSMFMLSPDAENVLEKYTFSNAMAQSVKLGIWEDTLDKFADSIAEVTDDLQRGKPILMSRAEVLRKTGTLYALRHHINLESDLLDTPDFYWEQAELEKLYLQTVAYFSITRRTKILNEKLSHCAELVELVAAQLSDHHHVRLEWMIIILIMVEVGFEVLHFVDRYWSIIAG